MKTLLSIILLLLIGNNSFAFPRCFLYGSTLSRSAGNNGANFSSIADNIRLNFEATSVKKCEQMIKNYCKYNLIEKNIRPKVLKGYFQATENEKTKTNFNIAENCQISKVDSEISESNE